MDKDKASYLLRGTSCVGEPGSNALAALQAGDLTYFVDTLNREDYQGKGWLSWLRGCKLVPK